MASVGNEGLAGLDGAQHVVGASAVMGLAGRQLERDRQAVGVAATLFFCRAQVWTNPSQRRGRCTWRGRRRTGRHSLFALLSYRFGALCRDWVHRGDCPLRRDWRACGRADARLVDGSALRRALQAVAASLERAMLKRGDPRLRFG